MEITVLADLYPPAVGRDPDCAEALVQRLVEQGHTVTVVTSTALTRTALSEPNAPTGPAGVRTAGAVSVRRHHARSWLAPRLVRLQQRLGSTGRRLEPLAAFIVSGAWAPGMARDAAATPASLIAALDAGNSPAYGLIAARARRVPLVLIAAGSPHGPDRLARRADAYLGDPERAGRLGLVSCLRVEDALGAL